MPSIRSWSCNNPAARPSVCPALEFPDDADDDSPRYVVAAWHRIESYTAIRFGLRSFEAIVEGPGNFEVPLYPATILTVEKWLDNSWTAVSLAPSPLGGLVLDEIGPFRVSGHVGSSDTPPEGFRLAVERLAHYLIAIRDTATEELSSTITKSQIGPLSMEKQRATNFAARAIQLSGAADLLRPFRRLGFISAQQVP